MLIRFFNALRGKRRFPSVLVSSFNLLECLKQNFAFADMEQFYLLARLCMVKDEKYYDRFDRAFSRYFKELSVLDDLLLDAIPDEWLRRQFEASLSDEERAMIESLGRAG
jgi:uncharacterized protein